MSAVVVVSVQVVPALELMSLSTPCDKRTENSTTCRSGQGMRTGHRQRRRLPIGCQIRGNQSSAPHGLAFKVSNHAGGPPSLSGTKSAAPRRQHHHTLHHGNRASRASSSLSALIFVCFCVCRRNTHTADRLIFICHEVGPFPAASRLISCLISTRRSATIP